MNAIDLEAEYNNRARVPEHPAIFQRWQQDAPAFRADHANAELDLVYGGTARIATRYVPVAGANHFTVIDPLANRESALTARLVELTRTIV